MPTTLAKIALVASALVFIVFGAGFLIVPVQWAAMVDIALPTATARTDVRATYGGFDLGIGAYLLLCAGQAQWLRPGLAVLGFAAGGFGSGRLFGIAVDGTTGPLMPMFAALELSVAAVAVLLLRRLPRTAA